MGSADASGEGTNAKRCRQVSVGYDEARPSIESMIGSARHETADDDSPQRRIDVQAAGQVRVGCSGSLGDLVRWITRTDQAEAADRGGRRHLNVLG